MFQTKSKVVAALAGLATVFSALVVASPASAAVPTAPVIDSATLNGTDLTINVHAQTSGDDRTKLHYQWKLSTESSTSAYGNVAGRDYENTSATTASDSYTFTSGDGIVAGKSYDIRVQAGNVSGYNSTWRYFAVTVPDAPVDAPTVVSQNDGDIVVSWVNDPDLSTGDYKAAKIHVYRNGSYYSSKDFSAAAAADQEATFTNTDTTYAWSFKVSTQNSSGYSVDSPISDAVTFVSGKAGVVENATAVSDSDIQYGSGQIVVAWSNASYAPGGATKIKIEWKATDGSWSSTNSYVPSTYPSSHSVVVSSANLVPGTAYNVRLSVALEGSSPYTYGSLLTLAKTVTPLTAPGPVSNLVGTPEDKQVTLTWTKGKDGGSAITNYIVDYRKTSVTSWVSASVEHINTGSAAETATVTGLTNGTAYEFRVRAANAQGTDVDGVVLADPVTPNPMPGAPTSLTGAAANSAVNLGWVAPSADELHGQTVTDYKVEYKASTSSTWKTFARTASATPSALVTGLANGVAYNFRVSTKTAIGTSTAAVASATVTPSSSLGSPTLGQFPVSLSAGSVSISDNQSAQSASVITSPLTGAFKASSAGASAVFKSLDGLGLGLPLNASGVIKVFAGKKVAVSATGFKPGSNAALYIVGNSTALGTGLVSAAGTVKITGKLPATLVAGNLVLQLNGASSLNNLQSISIGATSGGSLLVTTKSVKFAVGSVTLTKTEKSKLKELVTGTTVTPTALRVIGNTYGKATAADKARALKRAKAVAAYLKSLGVTATFNTVANNGKAKTLSTARNVVVTVDAALN